MITTYKIFESIGEYPYTEIVDIMSIADKCLSANGEDFDSNEFSRKIKRKCLNKLCEFVASDESDYTIPGKKIKGLVTNVYVETWFDMDVWLKFTVNEIEYDVFYKKNVKVFLKEKPVKKLVDKTIDPYEEEDWDD
jgi:hypothetical protein